MKYLLHAALVLVATLPSAGPAEARPVPEPHTAAAVLAADNGWGDAETRGDVAFVDALLADGYRTIGHDGKVRTKADVLASTRARGGTPARAAEVAAWRAQHPTQGNVALFGDTAVLTWVTAGATDSGKVMSCDIFVYRGGRWRAIYSQHSDA
ncbi:MAG TPA: nuclear transport factor 2 family protein [Sphingomonas sp.]|nr:nuclear transport factor 2 family protein [Sphingomonas sp.]